MSKRTTASGRRTGQDAPDSADPSLPLKKRARQRLVGAVVICASAAIALPFVLDAEPRRPAPELAVVMPPTESAARAAAAGSTMSGRVEGARESEGNVLSAARAAAEVDDGALAGQPGPADHSPGADADDAKSSESKTVTPVIKPATAASKAADGKSAPKPADAKATAPAAKQAESKTAAPSAKANDPKSTASVSKTGEAKAAETRNTPTKSGEGRYLLQVGAYSGEAGANAAVERLKGMGLKAYTERIKTDAGEKIRVRVGPFPTREAADQARSKLQASGVQAALIAPASTR